MNKGRFTIPTDESFVEGTKIIAEKWGADAVRDCDGTKLPENPGRFGSCGNVKRCRSLALDKPLTRAEGSAI